jgi:methyltransferase (TIGR00027 family)
MSDEGRIRSIADTAIWAAAFRAAETERPDALFHDVYARNFAGLRGQEIARKLRGPSRGATWAWTMRTFLFDQFITEEIRNGVDLVINLAAGLDARPYRLELPVSLNWVEIDLPALLEFKEEMLDDATPRCILQRIPLDLSDAEARRQLFARLGRTSQRALIITEGLLVYFTAKDVGDLARDLAAVPGFQSWVLEIVSPGLLRRLQKTIGHELNRAGAPLQFGPPEGPDFFREYGWSVKEVRSIFKAAARAGRLPLLLRLLAFLPESSGRQGRSSWSGVCLLEKSAPSSKPA